MVNPDISKPARPRPGPAFALLVSGLALLAAFALGLGFVHVELPAVARILVSALTGQDVAAAGITPVERAVVLEVRLPRVLAAMAVGGALAVAGAVFQGVLMNPLADPYTLGVSAGAAFGACFALLLNLAALGAPSVPLWAFAGAAGSLLLVMYLASSAGGFSSNNLVLSGIIVASILSAGIGFLKYAADEQASVLLFWLMGSLASKTMGDALLVLATAIGGTLICLARARELNLMALGPRAAESLGVDTSRTRLLLLAAASLMAAVAVSVTGIIGFVGLIVPHAVRSVFGPDNRVLLPISLVAGALLLLGADTATRALLPGEIPIGVVTALLGGPFFLHIFRKRRVGKYGF
jgi:iron complex transport system permease protein